MRATVRDLPIVLLVVALPLLDLAALQGTSVVVSVPSEFLRLQSILSPSFTICQAFLLGIWIGIGRTRTAIRLPLAVGALGALIQLFCHYDNDKTLVVIYLSLIAGSTALAVGSGRIAGAFRLIRVGESMDAAGNATRAQRFQFTLSEMLQAVAGISAALAIVRFAFPPVIVPGGLRGFRPVGIGAFFVLGLIAMWAVLKRDFRIWRMGALAAATMAAAFTSAQAHGWIHPDASIVIWPYLASVAGTFFVCRICGYRIVGKHAGRVALASEVGQCERKAGAD